MLKTKDGKELDVEILAWEQARITLIKLDTELVKYRLEKILSVIRLGILLEQKFWIRTLRIFLYKMVKLSLSIVTFYLTA